MRYVLILLCFSLAYVGCSNSDRSKAVPITTTTTPPPPPPSGSPLGIDTAALPIGQVGVAYDFTLQASGGTPPYSWENQAAQPLPGGITLDLLTGRLTGVPLAPFTAFVGFAIQDSAGNSTVRDLILDITP